MKVNLIKAKTALAYAEKHAASLSSFEEWIYKVEHADWEKPTDIKATFASASLLGGGSNRVFFDVGGNNHRVLCEYYFSARIDTVTLFIKWIGTHAEYDKLCKNGEQDTVDEF